MTTVTLTTNAAGLKAIPEIIESFIPGMDLSLMTGMLDHLSSATGTVDAVLTLKDKSQVQVVITLTP